MQVQINKFKVLILVTTFAVIFTSSKNPDLNLQVTKRNDPDYRTTKNSNNFNEELSFPECPTWMYRANVTSQLEERTS